MRFVDRWIGAPICALLTLVRRVADRFGGGRPGPPRKVAAIKLAEQGATVLAYPALAKLRERIGDCLLYTSDAADDSVLV